MDVPGSNPQAATGIQSVGPGKRHPRLPTIQVPHALSPQHYIRYQEIGKLEVHTGNMAGITWKGITNTALHPRSLSNCHGQATVTVTVTVAGGILSPPGGGLTRMMRPDDFSQDLFRIYFVSGYLGYTYLHK